MEKTKILDLIPESLREELIQEIKEELDQRKIADEKKVRETKASSEEIEKIINHIM